MGVTLAIRFIAGRYHGTAWGHHVNEARVDWPPAPWRILRALLACYHERCPELDQDVVGSLLQKLSRPPRYDVPVYVEGHTRHYMPKDSYDRDQRDKVLDAFVAVPPNEPLLAQWSDVELTGPEEEVLQVLVARLTYLGRAESWCDVRAERRATLPEHPSYRPCQTVPLLTPVDATLDELGADTATLRKRGMTRPPGTRVVSYAVPIPAAPRQVTRFERGGDQLTLARFALAGKPLPALTETAHVAECARRELVAYGRNDRRFASSVLSGLDESGAPLVRDHSHAHYLPRDEDGDGRLDTLWVWARAGLDPAACDALARLEELRIRRPDGGGEGEAHQGGEGGPRADLFLTLLGIGDASLFREDRLARRTLGPARVWRSATPYLITRHPRMRDGVWRDTVSDQVRRELAQRSWPDPQSVEVSAELPGEQPRRETPLRYAPGSAASHPIRWLEFRRWLSRRRPASPIGFGIRITFEQERCGPLALGFGAHFGLGSFQAEEDS